MRKVIVGAIGVVVVFVVLVLWQYAQAIAAVVGFVGFMGGLLYMTMILYDHWMLMKIRHQHLLVPQQQTVVKEEPKILTPTPPASSSSSSIITAELLPAAAEKFLVGYDAKTGEPVETPDLRTTGIIGMQGAGKTVTTLYWIVEAIKRTNGNIRFVIIDPHMNGATDQSLVKRVPFLKPFFLTLEDVRSSASPHYQSLVQRYAAIHNPTDGISDIESAIGWSKIFKAEYQARRDGADHSMTWVFIVDEYSEICSEADHEAVEKITETFKRIGQSARKFDMHSLIIAQDWRANTVGDTGVRGTIPQWYVHRSQEAWAKAVLPSDSVKLVGKLDTGHALAYTATGQVVEVEVPMMTEQEAAKIAKAYAPTRPLKRKEDVKDVVDLDVPKEPSVEFVEFDSSYLSSYEPSQMALVDTEWVDEEEMKAIIEAFITGLSETDIAKKVYGVKSGAELAEARIKVRNMLSARLAR